MRKPRHNFIVTMGIILFIAFCVMSIVKIQIDTNIKTAEKEELEQSIVKTKDEIDRYQKELDAPMDDEYIEEKAREKLNLRLPEEIIFYNDLIN